MLAAMTARLLTLLAAFLVVTAAAAAAVDVLSAGAVEPGLVAAAAQFQRQSGTAVQIRYAAAPGLRQKIAAGEPADLLIAPPGVVDDLAKLGKLDPAGARLVGRVGIGVAAPAGAQSPNVATVKALSGAVRRATKVIYNRASSGLYVEKMLAQLGLADVVAGKAVRVEDGAAVMQQLVGADPGTIGFAPVTEIKLFAGKGVQLVAPLPAEVQNYLVYVAVVLPAAASRPEAKALLDFLVGEAGPLLKAGGVERD